MSRYGQYLKEFIRTFETKPHVMESVEFHNRVLLERLLQNAQPNLDADVFVNLLALFSRNPGKLFVCFLLLIYLLFILFYFILSIIFLSLSLNKRREYK